MYKDEIVLNEFLFLSRIKKMSDARNTAIPDWHS